MNYPENIYREYEIVEKYIFGEKHYALVRVYNVFGFKFKKFKKVVDYWYSSEISWNGKTWHNTASILRSAVRVDNEEQERKFRKRVTK